MTFQHALVGPSTFFLLGAFSLVAAAEPANKAPDAPAGKPYVYKTSGGKARKMEVYFPPNHDAAQAKVPGLILFHGGGWTGGNLGQFRTACAYFASRGMVCATAEYHLPDKAAIAALPPGQSHKRLCVTDAKSAIRWFKQHAAQLGIDPQRIVTGGGSAGGHVSALATLNPGLNDPADPPGIDTRVVAYLWFNPAFSPGDKADAEIDILAHLKADLPPALVFFGDQDGWQAGWNAAHAQGKSLGVRSLDLRMAPGQGHGFFNQDPWRTITLLAADEFLVRQGLLAGLPTLKAPATGEKLVLPREAP